MQGKMISFRVSDETAWRWKKFIATQDRKVKELGELALTLLMDQFGFFPENGLEESAPVKETAVAAAAAAGEDFEDEAAAVESVAMDVLEEDEFDDLSNIFDAEASQ